MRATTSWRSRARRISPIACLTIVTALGGACADAASSWGANPRCVPTQLNRSAVLPYTSIAVSPLPDSYDASTHTQISLLGAPVSALHISSVSGSRSGAHPGSLRAYSQGDGASFVMAKGFVPGETVTVHGSAGAKAEPFAYSFVIAQPDVGIYSASATASSTQRDYAEMQHFHSAPTLQAPVTVVTAHAPQSTPGDILATPYDGPGPSGPMILDESGNLLWFHPLSGSLESTDLQVQSYDGAPALTWWQGSILEQGFGQGEEVIYNSAYRQIGRVLAGNGFKADLHEFHLTPEGTALLTVFHPIACDLSAYGGPADGDVTDGIFQEIDLATGLVRREWHSLDHVAPSASYSSAAGTSPHWPFDYFHPNSIDQLPAATPASSVTLLSSRNTWAVYELNTQTGQIVSTIGGKHSSVHLAAGAATAFQHDATALGNGTISLFDNGAVPTVHPQSRALLLSIDAQTNTDTVIAQYEHAKPLSSGSQGSVEVQQDGDVFVGWGAQPYFSEFNAAGQLLFDAHMHGSYESYRAFRAAWAGAPAQPPAVALTAASASTIVYASWNGDTQTASWRVLGGPSAKKLAPVAAAARSGFETAIKIPASDIYIAVQALSTSGAVLGTSAVARR